MAMPGEMTRSHHERSELMRWRVYGVGLAIIIASAIGPKLLSWFAGKPSAPYPNSAYTEMAIAFTPVIISSVVFNDARSATSHA